MPSPRTEASGRLVSVRYSVVVPVYGNRDTVGSLIDRLEDLAGGLDGPLEAVFVVDGSPDDSFEVLQERLAASPLPTQLLSHSRNFGSFAAIRTGMAAARGDFLGVMAADLQEPPELMREFFSALAGGLADVAVGRRLGRGDPALSGGLARAYWGLYRRWVIREIPPGGVDVFAVTRRVAERLGDLRESHSSLVGLLYWVGFRRVEIPYTRLARASGASGWTLRRKVRYLSDSVYSFTDLPVRLLTGIGAFGTVFTTLVGLVVFVAWATGNVTASGYTPLMLVLLLATFVILFALGIVGSYVWRIYENSKGRPNAIVASAEVFGTASGAPPREGGTP